MLEHIYRRIQRNFEETKSLMNQLKIAGIELEEFHKMSLLQDALLQRLKTEIIQHSVKD